MTDSEHSETAGSRKRGSRQISTVWLLLGGCYLGVFGLMSLDRFVFGERLIVTPLRRYDRDLADKTGKVFRTVYFPILQVMIQLKII